MVNLRRLPGVFYNHKIKTGLFCLTIVSVVYFMNYWGFVCINYETRQEIERLCELFKNGQVMGNLCKPLCTEKEIHSISCTPQHSGKAFVFTAKWNNILIVLKSSFSGQERATSAPTLKPEQTSILSNSIKILTINNSPRHLFNYENIPRIGQRHSIIEAKRRQVPTVQKIDNHPKSFPFEKNQDGLNQMDKFDVQKTSEKDLELIIRNIISEKLNISVSNSQIEALKYLEMKNKFLYSESSQSRKIEKSNIFALLQSREYLLSHLFADREVFPQILGTCGYFYGVEHLKISQMNSFFMTDNQEEWSERMKLAILIMDFIEELETNFPDALHLCDIKMNHFGITSTGRLKFLDLDSVYTNNVIEKMVSSGRQCSKHEDCDFFDCKSTCGSETSTCDGGVANNNLQVICEKIFIGWTMSGKVIVPGLLMSEHTPASLAALLRLCAENVRAPVPEDIRQRLYTTLTEMYQILTQKLFM